MRSLHHPSLGTYFAHPLPTVPECHVGTVCRRKKTLRMVAGRLLPSGRPCRVFRCCVRPLALGTPQGLLALALIPLPANACTGLSLRRYASGVARTLRPILHGPLYVLMRLEPIIRFLIILLRLLLRRRNMFELFPVATEPYVECTVQYLRVSEYGKSVPNTSFRSNLCSFLWNTDGPGVDSVVTGESLGPRMTTPTARLDCC